MTSQITSLSKHPAVRLASERSERWSRRLAAHQAAARDPGVVVEGKLARVAGMRSRREFFNLGQV